MKNLLIFIFFIVVISANFLFSVDSVGQTASVFVDKSNQKKIFRIEIPYKEEVLFSTDQLPKQHPEHEAVHFAEQRFSHIAMAPDGRRMALSVDATPHDWVAIFDVKNKQLQSMDFFLEGKSLKPFWSFDGRFLVVEGELPLERKFLEVFDTEQDSICRIEGKKLGRKFLNFSKAWFSQDGESLFFQVEYNNSYRKKVGLKSRVVAPRIGKTNLKCQGLNVYSVKEFMEKFPEQLNLNETQVSTKDMGVSL